LGGAGNDALIGNTDANKLVGNGGNDSLIGGGGDDTLEGGGGDDTVSYADDTTGVTVDLGLGEASGPDSGNDTLSDIENAAGGAGNDTLVASGDGNKLIGNDGKDSLIGGTGDDTLDGGDGDDEILSGIGNDSLIGGEGADTFTFDLWNGTDTISDFEPAGCGCAGTVSDKIDVSAFGFTNPFEFAILLEPVIDGTWINLSETGGGDVFLDGVNILALNLDDFIF
jgi:Ca2+-binding RTX toxin-like protein